MKKVTFAVLFSILLICSCLFAACRSSSLFPGGNDTASGAGSDALYAAMIRDLEDQIAELQQSQYIFNAENQKELSRLQALLTELKGTAESDSSDSAPSSGSDGNTSSDPSDAPAPSPVFLYTRKEDSITITGYTGTDESLTLPSYIDGYEVTAIADNAFQSNTLKRIVIPNNVTSIGWFAFYECSALEAVTIPSAVTSIGYSAFPAAPNAAFTIYCHSDSFAQKYAASYGLSYAII